MYSKADCIKDCMDIFAAAEGNVIDIPGVGETVLYTEPLIGFADADDEIFNTFRRKEVMGLYQLVLCLCQEWDLVLQ